MKVIFIRHGQILENVDHTHPNADTELSEEGIRQTGLLAIRLKQIKIDKVISSPMTRTIQTSEIIKNVCEIPYTISDLFAEVKRPKELIGLKFGCEQEQNIWKIINEHTDNPDWHYSDEENFSDLKNRGLTALSYIKDTNVENLAIVTHSTILTMMICLMILGNNLEEKQFNSFREFAGTGNASITEIKYLEDKKKWKLLVWNDQSHLQR